MKFALKTNLHENCNERIETPSKFIDETYMDENGVVYDERDRMGEMQRESLANNEEEGV